MTITSPSSQCSVDALFPSLTTIDVRAEEIGRQTFQQLAHRLSAVSTDDSMERNLDPILVEGQSVRLLSES